MHSSVLFEVSAAICSFSSSEHIPRQGSNPAPETTTWRNLVHRTCAARKSCSLIQRKKRKGKVLFNDALNTFYLRLYGVGPLRLAREETHCRHIGYSFRLAARVLLYASCHRQDNTYHSLCYTSCGTLAGTRNSYMGPLATQRSEYI